MSTLPNSLAARDIASLVHPQTNLARHEDVGPLVIAEGKGVWLKDDDGNELLDTMSGLWCASLGYAPQRLADVAYTQMQKMTYSHLYSHRSHEPAIELAEKLLSIAPPGMAKVHFQNSGSEANDVTVKLCWYYHHALGQPQRRKFISRTGAYHGSSVATVSLTGKADMHEAFGLPLDGFLHTDMPYYFRDAEPGESEEDYATRLADSLEALIEKEGPETIAAFFAEPVLGSSGAIAPPATYFEKVQSILRRHGILFIADEVITGFGRTGKMWGCETFSLEPDIVTSAKALSAGALPISAIMMSDKVYQAMKLQSEATGNYAHGHTYAGHPVSAVVALETLNIYEEMDLAVHSARLSKVLASALAPLAENPLVAQIEQTGFMVGIELSSDGLGTTSQPDGKALSAMVSEIARSKGLVIKNIGSRICLAPAYVISEDELHEAATRLQSALNDAFAQIESD